MEFVKICICEGFRQNGLQIRIQRENLKNVRFLIVQRQKLIKKPNLVKFGKNTIPSDHNEARKGAWGSKNGAQNQPRGP